MQGAVGKPGQVVRVKLIGQALHRLDFEVEAELSVVRGHGEAEELPVGADRERRKPSTLELHVDRTHGQSDVVDQGPVEVPDDGCAVLVGPPVHCPLARA